MPTLTLDIRLCNLSMVVCVCVCAVCEGGTAGSILLGCWSVTVSLPSIKQVINWDGSI